ncbi:MAG: molecular chaperone [Proteobacteria bacterium]|nr:molecular chaperone [Pseudomonadota bacterium]
MRFPGQRLAAYFFCLFCGISAASAMTVTPMQIEMSSIGRQSRGVITVVNDSELPLPVEIVIKRASLDQRGVPRLSNAGEEFLVMPPQALIAPGATQNFRLQWLGEPLLEKSESFFFYVNQIPIKLSGRHHDVQLVFSVGVMANVAPPRGVPALNVVGSSIVIDKSGRRYPAITVENPTRVHALFPQSTVQVSSGSWSETISSGELAQFIGIGLVQPGHRRRFVLPVVLPAAAASVQCKLQFKPQR